MAAVPARDHQPGQLIEPADVFPHPDHAQQLCLDAGRVLVLYGVLVAIPFPTAFDVTDAPYATRAFVGFLLWILGACLLLLALTPAAAPWAVRAGEAVASAVLRCLLPPVN